MAHYLPGKGVSKLRWTARSRLALREGTIHAWCRITIARRGRETGSIWAVKASCRSKTKKDRWGGKPEGVGEKKLKVRDFALVTGQIM